MSPGQVMLSVSIVALFLLSLLIVRVLSLRHGVTVRGQVFGAIAAITLTVTLSFGLIVVDRFEARSLAFAHQAAADDAQVVANLTERSMAVLGLSIEAGAGILDSERILYGFSEGPGDTRVQLVSANGMVLFDSLQNGQEGQSVAHEVDVSAALAARAAPGVPTSDKNVVVASVPIRARGEIVGVARVHKSAYSMSELMNDIGTKVALLAVILATVAALCGLWIGSGLAAPVVALTNAANRIAEGERQARLPTPRGREVEALTSAFEAMRTELEQRHAIEALAADLSHELKNPVASIRAAAEVLSDAIDDDPDGAKRFVEQIGSNAERLVELTRDLLDLARLESRGVKHQRIDVGEVAEEAIEPVAAQALAREVKVDLQVEGEFRAAGDATWLRRAIENLTANAVSFSPAGGKVSVQVVAAPGTVEIRVADEGPGVDPVLQDRIFERFVTSRGSEQEGRGSGLGLAIVRAVAESHGGGAVLRSTGPQGSMFVISIPRG